MKILTFVLPIFAVVVSILSLFIILRNNKRHIRIAKLEELLEINLFLLYHYEALLDLFKLQREISQLKLQGVGTGVFTLQEEEEKQIQAFFEMTGQNTYLQKLMRMEVLSRSYLPNKAVKFEILSLADMYSNLFLTTLFKDTASKVAFEKYPEITKLFDYSERIENGIIKEMHLGNKILRAADVDSYRGILKLELGLS